MVGETHEIRRNIAETRQEIDTHLQELGGRMESTLDVQQKVRQNWPQVLMGAAVAGLALGFLTGHGSSRRKMRLLSEKEVRRAKERGRLEGARKLGESERDLYGIL